MFFEFEEFWLLVKIDYGLVKLVVIMMVDGGLDENLCY